MPKTLQVLKEIFFISNPLCCLDWLFFEKVQCRVLSGLAPKALKTAVIKQIKKANLAPSVPKPLQAHFKAASHLYDHTENFLEKYVVDLQIVSQQLNNNFTSNYNHLSVNH